MLSLSFSLWTSVRRNHLRKLSVMRASALHVKLFTNVGAGIRVSLNYSITRSLGRIRSLKSEERQTFNYKSNSFISLKLPPFSISLLLPFSLFREKYICLHKMILYIYIAITVRQDIHSQTRVDRVFCSLAAFKALRIYNPRDSSLRFRPIENVILKISGYRISLAFLNAARKEHCLSSPRIYKLAFSRSRIYKGRVETFPFLRDVSLRVSPCDITQCLRNPFSRCRSNILYIYIFFIAAEFLILHGGIENKICAVRKVSTPAAYCHARGDLDECLNQVCENL